MIYKIFGDNFDPDEFTNLVGIFPTEVVYKGELIGKRIKREAETNSWELRIEKSVSYVDELIRDFLLQIKGKEEIIKQITSKNESVIDIIIDFNRPTGPSFYIDKKVLKELSVLNLGIDIDLYSHSEVSTK